MTKPTTPLRQRMEDMAIRNMSPLTQAAYVRAVANFAIHHGASPDKLTFEDVRSYQVHLIERGLKVGDDHPDHVRFAVPLWNHARAEGCLRAEGRAKGKVVVEVR